MTMSSQSTSLLEEFRASSLSPPLLQSLLHKLLSHPKIFNGFSDVLGLPAVQSCLAGMDDAKRGQLVRTVELFAWGTVRDYHALREKDGVWSLNDAQLEKLRMLSAVSVARDRVDRHNKEDTDVEMAGASPRRPRKSPGKERSVLSVPYAALADELRMLGPDGGYDEGRDLRPLEDLLANCVYSNLLAGRLDQASGCFCIDPHVPVVHDGGVHGSILSRDVDTSSPESAERELGRMVSALETFLGQSNALLGTLEESAAAVASDRTADEARWKAVAKAVEECQTKGRDGPGSGAMGMMMDVARGVRGGGHEDPMDVVDAMGGTRRVKRSKGVHA